MTGTVTGWSGEEEEDEAAFLRHICFIFDLLFFF